MTAGATHTDKGVDSPLDLTDDQRYRALVARDARFDGRFIVGVRTTGIYCRPSCPTPIQPLRKNIDFHPTTASAQRAGLRACKRCRPDASPGSPEWDLRSDLVARAMQLINTGWLDHHSVPELAAHLGVTPRHLRRITTAELGAPPLSIARAQRAQTARILIETTRLTFAEISRASGFSSLRQFNDTIRAVFDATPTRLRATSSAATGPPGRVSLRLPFRSPMASGLLFDWWARRSIPGVAQVLDGELCTALRLHHGNAIARLTATDTWIDCVLELDDMADLPTAVAQCRAMLDLDADPVAIEHTLARVEPLRRSITDRPGLRSPGCADGFATVVFAVLGQQRSVAAARTIAGRIVDRARGHANAEGLRPFPSPGELAELDFSELGLNQRAIDTIRALAVVFDGRDRELGPGGDRRAICDELLTVKGIGPWTTNYVAMRVFHDPDVFLAGDLIAERTRDALGLDLASVEHVRPWRSYLTHHLWAMSTEVAQQQKDS